MKKYGIFSILFLLFSLVGVLYLVKNNQDIRDGACDIPTIIPKPPTNTPILPSSTPKVPTKTPEPTNTPTLTPTSTPKPTNTPTPTATSTPKPTNTPIPTEVIAQGPSPTRIILLESGVEFPSQILTIFGGIITLLGFLILL